MNNIFIAPNDILAGYYIGPINQKAIEKLCWVFDRFPLSPMEHRNFLEFLDFSPIQKEFKILLLDTYNKNVEMFRDIKFTIGNTGDN